MYKLIGLNSSSIALFWVNRLKKKNMKPLEKGASQLFSLSGNFGIVAQ